MNTGRTLTVQIIVLLMVTVGWVSLLHGSAGVSVPVDGLIRPGGEVKVSSLPSNERAGPRVSTSPTGEVYVVWSALNSTRWEVMFTNSSNLSFPVERRIDSLDNSTNHTMPALAVSPSGVIYVAWVSANDSGSAIYFRRSLDGGATFDPPLRVDQGTFAGVNRSAPVLASRGDEVYLAWADNRSGDLDIYLRASYDRGATFSPETRVSVAPSDQRGPCIVLNGSSQVILAWEDTRNGDTDIYASASWDRGTTFTFPVRVNDDTTRRDQYDPDLGIDASGRVWIIWTDLRFKTPYIFYTHTRNITDITFNSRLNLLNYAQGDPAAVYTSVPTVFWVNLSSNRLMYSQYNVSDFAPESGLTSSAGPESQVSASRSSNDTIYVVWRDGRSGEPDIYLRYGDGTGPAVSILSPVAGSSVNLTGVDIVYTSTDPSGMPVSPVSIEYSLDGSSWVTIAASRPANDIYRWTPPAGISHAAVIRVSAHDTLWNWNSAETPIDLDTTAPYVISVLPRDGETNVSVQSQVKVTFSEPMNVTSVESGFVLTTSGPPIPGVFSWTGSSMRFVPNTALDEGHEYTVLIAGARDLAGNPTVVPFTSRFITSDMVPPSVSILSPAGGVIWNSFPHDIRYSVSDNGALPNGSVDISYSEDNGTTWRPVASGLDPTGSYTWTAPPGVDTSDARIRITVTDVAGNTGLNLSGRFRLDSTLPQVNATSPSNGSVDVPIDAVVSISFSEPMNRSSVESSFSLSGPTGKVIGSGSWSGMDFVFTPLKPLLSAAVYWANVSGVDLAGNPLAGTTLTFRTKDVRGPAITILAPEKGATVNGTGAYTIRYIISDETGIRADSVDIYLRYSPGNTTWTQVVKNWGNMTAYAWFPPGGIYADSVYLRIDAEDIFGNRGSQVSERFILDTARPSVVSTSPSNEESDVPLDSVIYITFSEKMNISRGVEVSMEPVAQIERSWPSNITLALAPAVALQPGTEYTISLTDAYDLAGNAIPASSFRFTTTFRTLRGEITGVVFTVDHALLGDVDVVARLKGSIVATVKTSANGSFRVVNLLPGDYEVTFRKDGFFSKTVTANVSAGSVTNLGGIILVQVPREEQNWFPVLVLLMAVVALTGVFIIIYVRMKRIEEREKFLSYISDIEKGTEEYREEEGEEAPEERKEVPEEKGVEIELGEPYLFIERGCKHGYRQFSLLLLSGLKGVCVTGRSPRGVWEKYLSVLTPDKKRSPSGKQPFFFLDMATRKVEMRGFEKEKGNGREKREEGVTEEKGAKSEKREEARPGVEFVCLRGKRKPGAKMFSRSLWRFMMEEPGNVVYIDSFSDLADAYTLPRAKEMLAALVGEAKETRTTLIVSLGSVESEVREDLEAIIENIYEPEAV